jgi:hypothetical protein
MRLRRSPISISYINTINIYKLQLSIGILTYESVVRQIVLNILLAKLIKRRLYANVSGKYVLIVDKIGMKIHVKMNISCNMGR